MGYISNPFFWAPVGAKNGLDISAGLDSPAEMWNTTLPYQKSAVAEL